MQCGLIKVQSHSSNNNNPEETHVQGDYNNLCADRRRAMHAGAWM